MRLRRFSMRLLIGLIAVVGLNLGVLRALEYLVPMAGYTLGLTIFLFEISMYLTWKTRRAARAFWIGFTFFGMLAYLSLVWGLCFPDLIQINFHTGTSDETHVLPGAVLGKVWMSYAEVVSDKLMPVLRKTGYDGQVFRTVDPSSHR